MNTCYRRRERVNKQRLHDDGTITVQYTMKNPPESSSFTAGLRNLCPSCPRPQPRHFKFHTTVIRTEESAHTRAPSGTVSMRLSLVRRNLNCLDIFDMRVSTLSRTRPMAIATSEGDAIRYLRARTRPASLPNLHESKSTNLKTV